MDKDEFLSKNNITADSFERCSLSWELLEKIHDDYVERADELKETAELFVRTIQRCHKVHSVRWRVKDVEHLLEKIIRKTDPESGFYSDKYTNISEQNYHEIITDLIGVRAIHLFKDDFIDIDKFLCNYWSKHETVTVYKREGDLEEDFDNLQGDFEVKKHSAGYRSIHYIFETKPMNKQVFVEVQVRTIFEEGWSEIDHNIRYPNFSDDELVSYFLKVFNRMAGSADEMGTFVKNLVCEIESYQESVAKLTEERDESIEQIEDLVAQLESLNGVNNESKSTIESLKKEMSKLKNQSRPIEIKRKSRVPMPTRSLFDIIEKEKSGKVDPFKIKRKGT